MNSSTRLCLRLPAMLRQKSPSRTPIMQAPIEQLTVSHWLAVKIGSQREFSPRFGCGAPRLTLTASSSPENQRRFESNQGATRCRQFVRSPAALLPSSASPHKSLYLQSMERNATSRIASCCVSATNHDEDPSFWPRWQMRISRRTMTDIQIDAESCKNSSGNDFSLFPLLYLSVFPPH